MEKNICGGPERCEISIRDELFRLGIAIDRREPDRLRLKKISHAIGTRTKPPTDGDTPIFLTVAVPDEVTVRRERRVVADSPHAGQFRSI
ncbi:hypothetical protein At1D1460_28050 [Agrobacterium tumefaciens]|nr:hypothetical protein At1D1460_28050 [Agrobacterium tumefaciens]